MLWRMFGCLEVYFCLFLLNECSVFTILRKTLVNTAVMYKYTVWCFHALSLSVLQILKAPCLLLSLFTSLNLCSGKFGTPITDDVSKLSLLVRLLSCYTHRYTPHTVFICCLYGYKCCMLRNWDSEIFYENLSVFIPSAEAEYPLWLWNSC